MKKLNRFSMCQDGAGKADVDQLQGAEVSGKKEESFEEIVIKSDDDEEGAGKEDGAGKGEDQPEAPPGEPLSFNQRRLGQGIVVPQGDDGERGYGSDEAAPEYSYEYNVKNTAANAAAASSEARRGVVRHRHRGARSARETLTSSHPLKVAKGPQAVGLGKDGDVEHDATTLLFEGDETDDSSDDNAHGSGDFDADLVVSMDDIRAAKAAKEAEAPPNAVVSTPFGICEVLHVDEADGGAHLQLATANSSVSLFVPQFNTIIRDPQRQDFTGLSQKETRIYYRCKADGRLYIDRKSTLPSNARCVSFAHARVCLVRRGEDWTCWCPHGGCGPSQTFFVCLFVFVCLQTVGQREEQEPKRRRLRNKSVQRWSAKFDSEFGGSERPRPSAQGN